MPTYSRDLTGVVFGRLRVTGRVEDDARRWNCLCDPAHGGCGATKPAVVRRALVKGETRSCGCLRRDRTKALGLAGAGRKRPSADLTSQTFGRWTVIGRSAHQPGNRTVFWDCRCDCGMVRRYHVKTLKGPGHSKCIQCHLRTPRKSVCKTCGAEFVGTLRQIYCSLDCRGRGRAVNLAGRVFGLLTVVRRAQPTEVASRYRNAHWLCRCRCGTERVVDNQNLLRGQTTGCGKHCPARQSAG